MAVNKRLLQGAAAAGELVPSEHFGVVLYEGDGSSSHSINGGKFGAAGYFNGTSSYIDTGIKNTVGTRTLSLWIYYTGAPSATETLIGGVSSGSAGYTIRLETSLLKFQQQGEASLASTSLSNLNTNAWNHIVGVIDGSTSTLYLNGSSVGTGTVTDAGTHNLFIGANNDVGSASQYYNGKIDQVRIFQKALSSSEVSTLYAETDVESLDPLSEDTTDTLQVLGDSSCIATYRFENDETDLSGSYDGTGTEIQYAAGRYGQAASFNGSSSKVSIPDVIDFATGEHTISAWVYFTDSSVSRFISNLYTGTVPDGSFDFVWIPSSSKVNIDFSIGGSNYTNEITGLTTNTWYHIAVTFVNNGTCTAYLNGSSVDTVTAPSFTASSY